MKKTFISVLLLVFLIIIIGSFFGCGAIISLIDSTKCSNSYVNGIYENYPMTKYIIDHNNTKTTKSGIRVDISNQGVDLDKIDTLTDDVEKCLRGFGYKAVKRCGFTIKIAPDWRQQDCAGGQLFPCVNAGFSAGCEKNECACGCYGAIQYPSFIITTPDLKSYKHELIHLVTFSVHGDQEKDLDKIPKVFSCQ